MQGEKGVINNHIKSEHSVIIFLIATYIILSEGLDFISIIFKSPFLIIGFYILFLIILLGLKLFKIKDVSKNKIAIYIFSGLVLDSIFSFSPSFFKLFLNNVFIFYTVNFITQSIFTIIFFRYYFLLSIKQTLQLFLYLTILSFILIILINKLLLF